MFRCILNSNMAWNPFRRKAAQSRAFAVGKTHDSRGTAATPNSKNPMILAAAAGLTDIMNRTNQLRDNSKYDTEFDIFDAMLSLDPELNGAVRAVSLTANNYTINYRGAKNARIREAIRVLVEDTLGNQFDDFLINAMRSMMVYGNDINKLVGTSREGITDIQSLPLAQITIMDERSLNATVDKLAPIITPTRYLLREGETTVQEFPSDEILHIRIDARSNWFLDTENRWSYGVWGASRFSALKQAIRAKYNTVNNRMALEESMTKQFITINMKAVEHITDPDEQRDRLVHIMDEVVSMLESLRGDQIPIFPDYIEIHHTDTRATIPDNTAFLDNVNADIAAVLQVPRVAAGQERGSTFAATYNANVWATSAIRRMQSILRESVHDLFSQHLTLLNIQHQRRDLPFLEFEPIEEETPTTAMQRTALGYNAGILTLNQALENLNLPTEGRKGNERKMGGGAANVGRLPREEAQPGTTREDET
jgi:hypothetical protein